MTAVQGPPPELIFRRLVRPVAMLRELWGRRELVVVLTERELRARYKQTRVGFAWALLTPFLMMVVFTLFFKRVADVSTVGVPYPLFSYVGLLSWTFFSGRPVEGRGEHRPEPDPAQQGVLPARGVPDRLGRHRRRRHARSRCRSSACCS